MDHVITYTEFDAGATRDVGSLDSGPTQTEASTVAQDRAALLQDLCNSMPDHVPPVDLGANIHESETVDFAVTIAEFVKPELFVQLELAQRGWFFYRAHPGGDWDVKRGGNSQFAEFGNWQYGFVGAGGGFSLEELQRGAGFAQQWLQKGYRAENGTFYGAPPYGDHPEDYHMIAEGYAAYERVKNQFGADLSRLARLSAPLQDACAGYRAGDRPVISR